MYVVLDLTQNRSSIVVRPSRCVMHESMPYGVCESLDMQLRAVDGVRLEKVDEYT